MCDGVVVAVFCAFVIAVVIFKDEENEDVVAVVVVVVLFGATSFCVNTWGEGEEGDALCCRLLCCCWCEW